MDIGFLCDSTLRMLHGVPLAMMLALPALGAGFVLALGSALCRMSARRRLRAPADAFAYVMRGTPMILQLFFVYFGLGQIEAIRHSVIWPLAREASFCAFLVLTLNTAAYGGEIIRAGLRSVPEGVREAASALGLSRWQRFRLVVLPLAIRQMLPAYGNEVALLIKATSVTSTITLMEITGIARSIVSETYRPVEVFVAAGLIYLVLTASFTAVVGVMERQMRLP